MQSRSRVSQSVNLSQNRPQHEGVGFRLAYNKLYRARDALTCHSLHVQFQLNNWSNRVSV